MSFERCVEDAIELVDHLRSYLEKDRVVLLAGSMGTMIGTPLVQRRPDLFQVYVATDLHVDMIDNEAESYRRALRNPKAAKALAAIGPDSATWDLRAWEVKMRWSMDNAVLGKLFLPLVLRREVYGWRWSRARPLRRVHPPRPLPGTAAGRSGTALARGGRGPGPFRYRDEAQGPGPPDSLEVHERENSASGPPRARPVLLMDYFVHP
jgi:pimeloyl-ACP methyl ester carboxylesterase